MFNLKMLIEPTGCQDVVTALWFLGIVEFGERACIAEVHHAKKN